MSIVDPTIEWGLPLTVESSRYLENSWEATFRGSAMVLTERVQNRQVWGLGGAVGLRYLFKEESVRPYVGAELNYLHIFRDEGLSNLVGLAPNLGIDLFVSDSVAVGARGLLNIYWALNEALRLAPGGQLVISTYF